MIFQAIVAPTYDPQQVQGLANTIFWLFVGLAGGIIIIYVIWKTIKYVTYPYHVTIIEQVGKGEMQKTVRAKMIQDADKNYMLHYMGVGYSPVFDDFSTYLRTVKTKMFGILPSSMRGFSVYKMGDKIMPIRIESNPGLVPVDYDMFNYMQWRIKANIAKYTKNDKLMQLLPIIGLGMVVIAFIMGSIFWGKHVENIALNILNTAGSTAREVLTNTGAQQILTAG